MSLAEALLSDAGIEDPPLRIRALLLPTSDEQEADFLLRHARVLRNEVTMLELRAEQLLRRKAAPVMRDEVT